MKEGGEEREGEKREGEKREKVGCNGGGRGKIRGKYTIELHLGHNDYESSWPLALSNRRPIPGALGISALSMV